MKNRKVLLVSIVMSVMLMVLVTSCGKKDQEEKQAVTKQAAPQVVVDEAKVYKLGLSLAITGPTSDAGNPYAKGVEDYFKYVNEEKLLGKVFCT